MKKFSPSLTARTARLVWALPCLLAAACAQPGSTPLSRVSFYSAHAAQTDANPQQSACGPTRRGQIGVSRDLLKAFPCGTWVKVTMKNGKTFTGKINDVMNARYSRSVDVMVSSRGEALRLGVSSGRIARLR